MLKVALIACTLMLGGCYCNQIDSWLNGEPPAARPLK